MPTEFVGLVKSHIGHAIYCWGGTGQKVVSETQIKSMETSPANALRAIAFWKKLKAAGVDPIWMDDCSGLEVWPLRKLGLLTDRLTANGFSNLCASIPTAQLRVGDLVFALDDNGHAFHMGTVTRVQNGILVTEARGRDYGVVERPISSGSWNDYGHNPFINTKEEDMILEKGCPDGQSVYAYQNICKKLGGAVGVFDDMILKDATGQPLHTGCDGAYGSTMVIVTNFFCTKYKLPISTLGTVTDALLGKMSLALQALTSGTTQAEYDVLKGKYDVSQTRIGVLTNDLAIANAKIASLGAQITNLESRVGQISILQQKLDAEILKSADLAVQLAKSKADAEKYHTDLSTLASIITEYS